MSKHLTFTERTLIERYLALDYSLSYIAHRLHRSASTIIREVKNRRCFVSRFTQRPNDCIYYLNCLRKNLCETETKYSCFGKCKLCTEYDCKVLCPHYVSEHCQFLDKAPFVCNFCKEEKSCKRIHAYYSAHKANAQYLKNLKDSRLGPHASEEELAQINALIAPLLWKGQSLNHILSSHSSEIRFCERTIYNYIDRKLFTIRNIDLPKKVKYKPRHTETVLTKMNYRCRKGRTIEDFKNFIQEHPNTSIVEMDTVKGARNSGQVLLTFIFRENNFMLIFLMPDGTQKSVNGVFDNLTEKLGIDLFRKIFPVILTDNGVEFKGPHNLEFYRTGERRTRIFYCDPQASWQKAHIEKNHALIRRILPKGTTFKFLRQEDVNLITMHINSVTREIFDNLTPFDLMTSDKYKKLLAALALSAIPPDEVCLKPILLKQNR